MVCPLCNGDGKRIIVCKHPYTGRLKTVTEWCLCTKSKFVSEVYSLLGWLGETYLPLEKIDEKLVFNPDLINSPNLYIKATNYKIFCLHIKSFIMKHRFKTNPPRIYFCPAIDILKKFYVRQEDNSCPSLSDLNEFDLLIFTLGTMEKNDQLGTCIAQVVYNRIAICKPTWIYLPEYTLLENTREVSNELKVVLDPKANKYIEISLTNGNMEIKSVQHVQKKAESFRR